MSFIQAQFKLPALGLLLLLFLVACKPEPPVDTSYETHYLPAELKQYFFHNAGDTLVYRDSITGWYDTAVCVIGGYEFVKSTFKDRVLFEEEATFPTYDFKLYSKTFYYHTRLRFTEGGGKVWEITENGSDILMRFPLVVGDSLPNGLSVGHSILQAFYPVMTIGAKEFRDVYKIKRRFLHSRMSQEADYYLAKNKGIVAIRDYTDNKLWVLQ